jgi:reverse gyrase
MEHRREMRAIYRSLCLNCEGAISDDRLLGMGVCERCLEGAEPPRGWGQLLKALRERGKLRLAEEVSAFHERLEEFSRFFRRAVGQRMWSLQEAWARRVLLGGSFSIVAPTGVGKTVFGIVSALYFAARGGRSYVIVPTSLLVQQASERLAAFSERLGVRPRVVCYHAGMSGSERGEALRRVAAGEFDVLVTTERFLVSHFEAVEGKAFDFVFVDDVDSFLKSQRNVDKVLKLLGFSDEAIASALRMMELRREARRLERMGRPPEQALSEVERLRGQVEEFRRRSKVGQLVVSGATVRARRTRRMRLFEELLGFQVGFKPEFLRNVKDFHLPMEGDVGRQALSIVKWFGGGCLIFVPSTAGRSYAVELAELLNANGVRAQAYVKMDEEMLSKFQSGEYDALVGVASSRSPLARGVDLPERVRYVVFAGVPRMELRLSWDEYSPSRLLALLKNVMGFLGRGAQDRASQLADELRRVLPVGRGTVERVREALERGARLEGFEERVARAVVEAREFLRQAITPAVIEAISASREASLKRRGGELYLVVADPVAYVQASGRASRLFAGGIARGASFIIVDDEKAFYALRKRLELMLGEFSPVEFSLEDAEGWLRGVDEDRQAIRDVREGRVTEELKDFIKVALLVVESPTKARTISRFFGRPSRRRVGGTTVLEVSAGEYVLNIVASMGHIYDLVTDEGFHGVEVEGGRFIPVYDFIRRCRRCGEQFAGPKSCPRCGGQECYSKEGLVKAMRRVALEVNRVFIATDPDVEGEKIAYDVYCTLHPMNDRIERLEFHEVTRRAFLQAMRERRGIDLKMVEAQLVRRIEDRWIGFELSRRLWERFQSRRLSAGRVQTPVLGWIVERTSEARRKKTVLSAALSNGLRVWVEAPTLHPRPEGLQGLKAKVEDLRVEERVVSPPPPYTTDSLIRDASAKLGFPAAKTMEVAQDLFELGLCTYHRTDSTTVSTVGIGIAREYIQERYPSLFAPRRYAAEGAHECIRPTRALDAERLRSMASLGLLRLPKRLTRDHLQLYDLIFRRFIASQMREARLLYQSFKVSIDGSQASVERPVKVVSDGFNVVLPVRLASPVEEGEYAVTSAKLLRLPAAKLFTQGEVVAYMKERAIGRPSTYAKTVSTILERGYAIERRNRLIGTPLGFKVYEYLSQNFGRYASEEATRRLEELMDLVEGGRADYNEVLRDLYQEALEIGDAQPTVSAKLSPQGP